ncbi:hypothetical protein VTI74DRAFT_937 [Chaetomium olivicolor]
MLLQPLTVAVGLLALPATQAFLIPPEVSDADIQVASTIESVGSQVAESQVVNLECPGCPILVKGRRGKGIQIKIHRPSHLELTFAVDHQPNHDRLLVNGFELYPSADALHEVLTAPQAVDQRHHGAEDKEKRHHRNHDHDHDHHDDGEHHKKKKKKRPHKLTPLPQRLGFGLHVSQPIKDAEGRFELVEVELQIIEVGSAFINGIPDVKVKLIKDDSGRLLMSQIEKSESKSLPKGSPKECETMMCKWLAIARERLRKLKSFAGHCHGPKVKGGTMEHPPHGDEVPHTYPHPHRPHHGPGSDPSKWIAPYQEHRWGKLFKHIASHILLPVLVGIVAGVTSSLIGMAVGKLVIVLWRTFFRRPSSHHRRHRSSSRSLHKAAMKEAAVEEEKSVLMEHQDPPPAYEEEEETAKRAQV